MESWTTVNGALLPSNVQLENSWKYNNGLDNPEGQNDFVQQRQRSNPERDLSVVVLATMREYQAFKTFFKVNLNEGGVAFTATWEWLFYYINLGTISSMRIITPPQVQWINADLFKIKFTVELVYKG